MPKVLEIIVEVPEQKFNWDLVMDIHNFEGSKDNMIMYSINTLTSSLK